MKENVGNNAVVDLAHYRAQAAQKPCKPLPSTIPDSLLDVVVYHLLMAGRAIAAHTNK